jgi:hypothetical protein
MEGGSTPADEATTDSGWTTSPPAASGALSQRTA